MIATTRKTNAQCTMVHLLFAARFLLSGRFGSNGPEASQQLSQTAPAIRASAMPTLGISQGTGEIRATKIRRNPLPFIAIAHRTRGISHFVRWPAGGHAERSQTRYA